MSNDNKLTEEEIKLYILNHTEAVRPECCICYNEAEFYDTYDSENYCKKCLIDELNKDPKEMRELIYD